MIDYLIIGQGICGTLLSYHLSKEGKDIRVMDDLQFNSASRVASGVINPVTGRQIVTTWMADTLLPHALESYKAIEEDLRINAISPANILSFPLTPQMVMAYHSGLQQAHPFLAEPANQDYREALRYVFEPVEIRPAYLVHVQTLLQRWQRELTASNRLLQERFHYDQLVLAGDHIQYKDITARKIIFCDGIASFDYPLWHRLPFGLNKGEALIARIPGLDHSRIYKTGLTTLVPWYDGLWWIGSTYNRDYTDVLPSAEFRERTVTALQHFLQLPFEITDHLAAVRPATLERKPFVGLHPVHACAGILNGMGTKGCSLGPLFAQQLTRYLLYDEPIMPDVDVRRFSRILQMNN